MCQQEHVPGYTILASARRTVNFGKRLVSLPSNQLSQAKPTTHNSNNKTNSKSLIRGFEWII